jgi:hypothetical protein
MAAKNKNYSAASMIYHLYKAAGINDIIVLAGLISESFNKRTGNTYIYSLLDSLIWFAGNMVLVPNALSEFIGILLADGGKININYGKMTNCMFTDTKQLNFEMEKQYYNARIYNGGSDRYKYGGFLVDDDVAEEFQVALQFLVRSVSYDLNFIKLIAKNSDQSEVLYTINYILYKFSDKNYVKMITCVDAEMAKKGGLLLLNTKDFLEYLRLHANKKVETNSANICLQFAVHAKDKPSECGKVEEKEPQNNQNTKENGSNIARVRDLQILQVLLDVLREKNIEKNLHFMGKMTENSFQELNNTFFDKDEKAGLENSFFYFQYCLLIMAIRGSSISKKEANEIVMSSIKICNIMYNVKEMTNLHHVYMDFTLETVGRIIATFDFEGNSEVKNNVHVLLGFTMPYESEKAFKILLKLIEAETLNSIPHMSYISNCSCCKSHAKCHKNVAATTAILASIRYLRTDCTLELILKGATLDAYGNGKDLVSFILKDVFKGYYPEVVRKRLSDMLEKIDAKLMEMQSRSDVVGSKIVKELKCFRDRVAVMHEFYNNEVEIKNKSSDKQKKLGVNKLKL